MRQTWNRCVGAMTWVMLVAIAVVAAAPSFAVVVPQDDPLREREFRHADLSYENIFRPVSELPLGVSRQLGSELSGLGVDPGHAFFDLRTGLWGTLILVEPLIPGSGVGNTLQWPDLGLEARPQGKALKQAVRDAFRSYLTAHAAELRIDPQELTEPAVMVIGDRLIQIHAGRTIDGIPVRDTFVKAALNSGNLVLYGERNWGPVEVSTAPQLSAAEAEEVVRGHVESFPFASLRDEPHLELIPTSSQPEEAATFLGAGLEYRLAWVLTPDFEDHLGAWEALVDAHSGELLSFVDTNHYASRRVEGWIYPVSNDEVGDDGTLQPGFPMPFADIALDGTDVGFTTTGGNSPTGSDAGAMATTLSGQFMNMNDSCGAINESAAAGDLDLEGIAGQTDCAVPAGHSPGDTNASRTGFYELNRLAEQARGYLPDNTWLQQQLTANMNINQPCNAFWNGSTVNFYRSAIAQGCRNTGEIAGVFDHEWGHGMDDNDGNPNVSNPGEGIADIFAHNRLNTSCIGRGFFIDSQCNGYGDPCLDCTGIRDIDWEKRVSMQPHDIAWIDANCGGGPAPCGGIVHCEGAVYSEAEYDLVHRDLQGFEGSPFNLDPNTALELGTRLTFYGSSNVGNWYQCTTDGTGGCNADSGYLGFLAADDDNGNITDGTPHMTAIFAAFDRHQISCNVPAVQDSGCAGGPTDAPANVTADTFDEGVQLSWDPVVGAEEYWIFRTEGVHGCDFGKALVGKTTDTTFTETGLRNGFEVFYGVVAVGASDACTSPMSTCVSAIPTAGPSGFIEGTVTDAVSGEPIEGADVEAVGPVTLGGVTDADGFYSILAPVGTYDVTASAFAFLPETVPGVVVTDGEVTTQDFALDPAPSGTVSGTVTDGSGHAWPLYARIEVGGASIPDVFTDPGTGSYSVDLPVGSTVTLTVNAVGPGYNAESREITVAPGQVEDFALMVDANTCTAPGYTFVPAPGAFEDDFESGFDGWTMDGLWNPENEADTCGSQVAPYPDPTNAAYYGQDGICTFNTGAANSGSLTQNTPITIPVGAPVLQFFSFEETECNGNCSFDNRFVEISTDGGTSWQTLGEGDTEDVWYQPEFDLSAFAGQSAQLRFRFASGDGVANAFFGWMVDDVRVGAFDCLPVPGGLLVGNVRDANTGLGLNDASVTSDNEPSDTTTTFSTPDDPNVDEGFYTLFSSLTGMQPFTATKDLYGPDTQTPNVAADAVVVQDFNLPAGLIEADPTSIEIEVLLNTTDATTLTLNNTGGADANFQISEGAAVGAPAVPPVPASDGNSPRGEAEPQPQPGRTTRDEARSDAARAADLASVLGSPLPSLQVINPLNAVVDCDAEPGIVIHDDGTVENGYSGNPATVSEVRFADEFTPSDYPAPFTAVCVAFLTQSGGPSSYDIDIVVFDDDGAGGSPGTELGSLAVTVPEIPVFPNPTPVWASFDISSLGITVEEGSVFIGVRYAPLGPPNVFLAADESTTNPPGFAGGYWWNNVANAWAPTGSVFPLYRSMMVRAVVGADAPWLSEDPTEGTVPAGGSALIDVMFDASPANGITHPGDYTASLVVSTDTPTTVPPIPVTMTVPLDGFGIFKGSVLGEVGPVPDATVEAIQNGEVIESTTTDVLGQYSLPIPPGTYDLRAFKGDDEDIETDVTVGPDQTVTVNFMISSGIGTFTGRVTGGPGGPVPDATVEALQDGEVIASTTTNAMGRYTLQVPPGTYDLHAFKGDREDTKADKTVGPDQTVTVNFKIR